MLPCPLLVLRGNRREATSRWTLDTFRNRPPRLSAGVTGVTVVTAGWGSQLKAQLSCKDFKGNKCEYQVYTLPLLPFCLSAEQGHVDFNKWRLIQGRPPRAEVSLLES